MTPIAYTTVLGTRGKYVANAYQTTIDSVADLQRFAIDYPQSEQAGRPVVLQAVERAAFAANGNYRAVRSAVLTALRTIGVVGCPLAALDIEGDWTPEQAAAIRYCVYSAADEAGIAWGNYEDTAATASDAAVLPRHFGGGPGPAKACPSPVMLPAVSLNPGAAAGDNAGPLKVDTPAKRVAWSVSILAACVRAEPDKALWPWVGTMRHADPGDPSRGRSPATLSELREVICHAWLYGQGKLLAFDEPRPGTADAVDLVRLLDDTAGELETLTRGLQPKRVLPGRVNVLGNPQTWLDLEDGSLVGRVDGAWHRIGA